MLDKFMLIQCRNCKIMGSSMTGKDTISVSHDHSFSTDPLFNIIEILPAT